LCGISFCGERWDYSYSPPRKIYVEDPDTIILAQEIYVEDPDTIILAQEISTNNITDRQVRAMESTAESVKTMANIMTGCLLVTIGLVVYSVISN
jgi:hypothetical protein